MVESPLPSYWHAFNLTIGILVDSLFGKFHTLHTKNLLQEKDSMMIQTTQWFILNSEKIISKPQFGKQSQAASLEWRMVRMKVQQSITPNELIHGGTDSRSTLLSLHSSIEWSIWTQMFCTNSKHPNENSREWKESHANRVLWLYG